jgi:release factor glutamine methyltransferase
MDRAALYRDGLEALSPEQEKVFWRLIERRAGGEPLAYITGRREFMGLDFMVNRSVLVPRPETELLVEKAIEILKSKGGSGSKPYPGPVAVDVGTGCGAIAVSIAANLDAAVVYATDISPAALEVAGQNAVRHGVERRVIFRQGDLLEPLADIPGFRADLVAANLPYVPSSELPGLMVDVREYEPHLALDGGEDGLDHYRRLAATVQGFLRKRGHLLVEIAPGQGGAMREVLGAGWKVELFCDLAGRERLVVAEMGLF